MKLKKILIIIVGTIIYSAGISLFLDPNGLAPGGVIGLSIIITHVIGGTTGTWYLLMNIPIIIVGYKKFGKQYIMISFFTIIANSIFTNILSQFLVVTDNLLLASIAGSILVGTGLGIILREGASTGGTDIIVKVLRNRYPSMKTSTIFLLLDMIVVALSGIAFKDFNIAMYALITVYLHGKVLDYILYGSDEAKLIYIISNQSDYISEKIINDLEISSTILYGYGAYSMEGKDIIMCVIKKRNTPHLENIVKNIDKQAFMIITSASEIYGEGYKNILMERM